MLRRSALSAVLSLLLGALMLSPARARVLPTTCAFDATTSTITVTMDGTVAALIHADEQGHVLLGATVCDPSATVETVARVMFSGRDHLDLTIDQRPVALAPGPVPDAMGIPEIKFTVGQGIALVSLTLIGTELADHVIAGDAGIDMNGDGDVDLSKTPERLTLVGMGGDDDLTTLGGGKAGGTMLGRAWLLGGDGNDTLLGNGATVLRGGPGDDTLTGTSTGDVADFSTALAAVRVDLTTGAATGDGTDTLTGIARVIGSPKGDVLIAGDAPTHLDGGSGDDQLVAGRSADILTGGLGHDLVSYARAPIGVKVSLATGMGSWGGDHLYFVERVLGSRFADLLVGGAGGDLLNGGLGNDSIKGGSGADTLSGAGGNDYMNGGLGKDRCLQGPGHGSKVDCEL